MNASIIWLRDIDHGQLELVGGKAANLGELAQIEGIHVPDGFCVSTEVFQRIHEETSSIREYLEQLSLLKLDDRQNIGELCAELRSVIEEIEIAEDITEEIARHLSLLGENDAYAVRSSATAEDLPTASFAGQQDTYLNIIGKEEILKHIRKCWASLFTERAAIYRLQNGFDHHKVHLAVVVQKMVFPQAAGVLFTADPVTSNRKIVSIDASFGLGEALVSGLVNADNYRVRNGEIIDKKISTKKLATVASQEGGTQEYEVETEQQNRQTLTDKQILRLEQIGRKIEEHFGHPQDIEWCLVDDTITIVQSRPITTLFPIPEAKDQENHVYVSVGHQQMMTDPIKPLGLSFFLLVTRAPMCKAGGWLFVDVTQHLASPTSRAMLLSGMGQHDPLIKDALQTIVEREVFIQSEADDTQAQSSGVGPPVAPQPPDPNDATIVAELIKKSQTSIAELKQTIQTKSGLDLFDFILADIEHAREILFDPQSSAVFMAAINATSWINQKMQEWLGEKNAADTLSQSVPNNITSEMGLALLDVADALRPYPDVNTYLQHVQDDTFLNGLAKIDGGQQARAVIDAFLDQYGMRCAGEIDITRTRWRENPATLIPLILSNVKNFAPGESKWKFAQGQQEALEKAEELCAQLAQLPDGQQKVAEAKHNINLVRSFMGYREYPKYSLVSRYFVYKQALLKEAERLVQTNVIHQREDIYYLTFDELRQVVRTNEVDYQVINQRKDDYQRYAKLTPPRVITSDGEIIAGAYKRENLPAEAIIGLPVSSGIVEGRARVILKMEDAELGDEDILITSFTDPSWTPLFVSIKGLVTEVGGLMTHGAVIAREYGLPAVVGVENATKLLKDGQRIRVNGTEGYVEIL